MPQYLMSVWHEDDYEIDFSTPEAERIVLQVSKFNADLQLADAMVFACGLLPASAAAVVRAVGAAADWQQGGYSSAAEQMGGFWVVEAADDAAARDWAERAAAACEGPVELRPLQGG